MKFNSRTLVIIVYDILVAAFAWLGAYWLRFNLDVPPEFETAALATLIWVVPLQAVVFWRFGLYRGIWRFASLPDLKRIVLAAGLAALLIPVALVLFRVHAIVPRSVLILDPLLLVMVMGGSRLAYRAWKEHRLASVLRPDSKPVLVAGAGSAADFLLRELARNPAGFHVVGLLDDSREKQGRLVQGVPVLGVLDDAAVVAKRLGVDDVVLALPSAAHEIRKRITEACTGAGLNVMTVPSLEDLVGGRVSVSSLRRIELDDLLGRDPVQLDDSGLHGLLTGQVVMVTGAGGSIGAELCRQIARFAPAKLVLFEQSELALYAMEQELPRRHPELAVVPVIGDAKNAAWVNRVMEMHRPAIVFHAAAYKHVPLMENGNAWEAVKNNVLGTQVVAAAAQVHGVGKFVLISTDKAVNPTNVMGASKRLAEMACQAMQQRAGDAPTGTRFVSVRFGNVLGSSGSVIPKFQKQIEAGGPVTVTHPEITRYFMSIPEAAQLVLQAGLMGKGGEIFVLDMGEPVKIAELAKLMIRLSGADEARIRIEYTGLRPGEKLYEELLADDESTLPTPHPKLRVAKARPADPGWHAECLDWLAYPDSYDEATVKRQLKTWVPEYQPESA
ncbi:putative epimerase/dehydratase polysaccharide-related biosynthesis protein [Thiobacillus denitrificans ATCC 25259]|uniref:Putative epimerase/dehydratase polysaccharide-related biosynthesis protein n=1 Tax=Thiobacillus denitrificans (strain ATCC 25259 / T1) TaxID=292415 RepID=Q3SHR2_THIDA|nr:nucleoside-diphosphate sugar epimerase/dehydratase [Thiobacillus denitrificans]AAZ97824.1 putative epimerase/dehydratase polysaccharide-related biosynthesis protein [Thiobacillus denitrificans ATCC 25259]